jgi:hypothetical protein
MQSMISRLLATVVSMLAVACIGCTADREQELIGKWQGDAMSATFAAVRMKEESGASTEDAKNAAKILAATFVDFESDKTFTAGMGGATTEGNWTFNKETGEAVLNITTMKGPDGVAVAQAPSSWTAYMDDSNMRLSFYPAPPESAAELRKSKVKGGLSGGISLYRR